MFPRVEDHGFEKRPAVFALASATECILSKPHHTVPSATCLGTSRKGIFLAWDRHFVVLSRAKASQWQRQFCGKRSSIRPRQNSI